MDRNAVSYEEDYFGWAMEQARLLRAGSFSEIDANNIAEELEDMGRSARRELRNRLAVLLMHLLKWRYQPAFRSHSWSGTIREQRREIQKLLEESSSLRPLITQDLVHAYQLAVYKAVAETGFAETSFPAATPFTLDQALANEFMPD
jgi:hypothetical protein